MKRFQSCLLLLALTALGSARVSSQVVISEFMASNRRTLADEDGDYSDWIELYNQSNVAVNLAGWSLTDDTALQDRWSFPSTSLPPKGFMLVFASGKNRAVPGAPLHTDFGLNANGDFLALLKADGTTVASEFSPQFPEQAPDISYGVAQTAVTNTLLAIASTARTHVPSSGVLGAAWTAPGFVDSSWTLGTTGVGYETAVPGLAVRNIKANVAVGSLAMAESVISNPSQQANVTGTNVTVVNYFGTGGDGHYGNNAVFPGHAPGADMDDFVIEATATITLPAAGNWTFGVSSDDGFSLSIGSFLMEYPDPRGPGDTLGVFTAPAPGDYALRLVFYERGGGSELELFAAPGIHAGWNSASFRLVGDTAGGGLTVKSLPISGGGSGSYRSLIRTDVQTAMKGINASAYIRVPFSVANPAVLESLSLRMRFDDGFVGFLNGQEVVRRNSPATPQWNSAATASRPNHEALLIEEINLSDRLGLIQAGGNVLALHGLNENSNDTDFLMLPELVEYRVTGSSNHFFSTATPGGINSAGFLAFVSDTKFSHDRGFYEAAFSLSITTATANATIRYTTDGTAPSLSNGLIYTGPILVSGTTTIRAAAFRSGFQPSNVDTQTYLFLDDVIRQSPDGSPPPGWPASWGANVVDYGMDPNVVNDPAYSGTIKSDLRSLPSFSVVMNLDDLFDPATGIYANPGQDGSAWERPCSLELIHPDGTEGFQIDAGIRIRGGFSRSTSNPKHAFRFFFRQEYGTPKLRYPLFGDQGTDAFDGIDLRTFQNYSWSFQGDGRGVFLRDQFGRDTQLTMGHAGERGDFCHLYINGQYWGLFNTCERPEASYGATYFGGNKEDYDVIKVEAGPYSINATDGTMDAWTELYNLALGGLGNDAAYQRLQGNNADGTPNPGYRNLLDVSNLIDYMLVILHGGNLDAPISNFIGNSRPNNWFGVRNRVGALGFRFFVHDAEHTLLPWDLGRDRTGPFGAGDTSVVYSNPQWLWQRLQANAEFRLRVADHVHRHFFNGGALTPGACLARFLARSNEIHRAVVGESARWGDAKRATAFTRNGDWLNAVTDVAENYLPQRSAIVLDQLRADGLYPTVVAPAFSQHGGNVPRGFTLAASAPAGTIYYTRDGTDPRLTGGAVAPAARTFSGLLTLNDSADIKARVLSDGVWSALNEAAFYVIQNFTNLLITEIMYHPPRATNYDGDEFEFIELKNVTSTNLELSGVRFTNGIGFTFPIGTLISPGGFVVLVSNPGAFTNRYPNVRVDGVYSGRLSNGGERVTLVHASGTPIFSVNYGDASPWPGTADGTGFTLVPAMPNMNPNPDDPLNWRSSSVIGGSPGADDPATAIGRIWITEVLTHTDPPQLDAIELYNPNPTNVNVGHWFLTDQRGVPAKFQIPANTTILSGGYLVLYETNFNATPGATNSFLLDSHGEEIFLYSASAGGALTGYSDGFSFGAAANGVSFGRYSISTGQAQYPAQRTNSLGADNVGPRIGPVVINEIRFHPAVGDEEFIELKNITGTAVKLFDAAFPTNTWKLEGIGFTFPPGVEIPPSGLMLLVGTDPAAFRTRYSIPAAVQIFGPYAGVLQDSGELLQLQRPDAPDLDTNTSGFFIPYIDVDAVRYNDKSPWPTNTDGGGPSLEKLNAAAYGNDPINWRASPGPASPGLENTGNRLPLVNAGGDRNLEANTFPVDDILNGAAADDGLPNPPGAVTIAWSQVSGPGPAIFANVNQLTTGVSYPGIGTYVLRITAHDGEHSSWDELTVVVRRAPELITLVPAGSTWKYLDDGSNQGTSWTARLFDDFFWAAGAAQLGYGDGDETRVVSYGPNINNKYLTTYFRHTFNVANPATVAGLTVNLLRDDGAIVYLNGTEVFRSNMPEGVIDYRTFASEGVAVPEESAFYPRTVDPTLLVTGDNVLAVEIHQNTTNSTDISFDLSLNGAAYPPNQPPTVDAGFDLAVTLPARASLFGAVLDDGLPIPPGQLAITWSKVSGPGPASFANSNAPVTTAGFSLAGTYVLRLTANDGAALATDDAVIRVDGSLPTEPRIESTQVTAGGSEFRLRFTATAGSSYTVQYRTSLSAGTWIKLSDVPAPGATQSVDVTDTTSGISPARFYRIVTPAQP